MQQDRPLIGIALMMGFCIVAPVGDAVAKLLGASVPLGQVVLLRFVIQALILIPIVWYSGRIWRGPRRRMSTQRSFTPVGDWLVLRSKSGCAKADGRLRRPRVANG